jgi:putative ABC transport system permease protein
VFKVALKGVAARKGRVVTTAIAVLLGVAFVTGTLVLSDTIVKVFNDLFADVNEGTDAIVREQSTFNDGFGTDIRGRIDAGVLPHVLDADGVAEAEGGINGAFAQYEDKDGEAIGNPGQGAPTLGFSWPEIDELNPFVLTDGDPPTGPDEVVMDRKTADDNDFAVGDTVTVLTQEAPAEFTISGIATFGTADSPAGATVALFDLPTAQAVLAEEGKFDSISVVADEGVSQEQLATNLRAALPTDQQLEVLTGDQITEENQDDIESQLSFFTTFLLVFAVIAVIVGGFVIYNTFGILVAQRGRELALLRAVGASRRQVIGSVLAEALAVATLGSVAGLAFGVLLASGLRSLLNAFGVELPTNKLVIEPNTFVVGIILGFAVTTFAAVFPAIRASRIPPVAAMRGVAIDDSGHSRIRTLVGLLITALGVLLLALGLFGDSDNALLMVGVGAGLVFLGVTVLGPVLVGPVTRVIGWPVARFRGMTGRLARENTLRNPKRTSSTAAALMIGVGLVGLITIVASSITLSIDQAIDESFTGDFVIDSGSFGFGGLSPTLADDLNELPEVQTATGIRYGIAKVRGFGEAMLGVDPATAFDIIDVDVLEGSTDDLDATGIALEEEKAADFGLHVGDSLPVEFAETGEQDLTVAMVYGDSDLLNGTNFLLGRDAYEANFADQFDLQVFVIQSDDVTPDAARTAIATVTDEFPNAELQDIAEFKQAQHDQINQFVSIIYALLMLAVIIALFGIGNTLALSIIERTHELGLLRAVGMTRSQLRTTVRWEAILTSVFGALLGLGIGLFFGWAIVEALKDEGLNAFRVPVGSLITIVVIAALAGVVAAVLPARRAAKLNILNAIAAGE